MESETIKVTANQARLWVKEFNERRERLQQTIDSKIEKVAKSGLTSVLIEGIDKENDGEYIENLYRNKGFSLSWELGNEVIFIISWNQSGR